ncbi:MAG: cation diffusion facilitator family transporter [Ruminococcus sp.]|jgi:cation diffusion facilitator family transporter
MDFLVKKFVKNYEQVQDSEVRTAYGMLASVVGILCNVFLFVVKFLIGFLLGSIAVTADAFNNLSDAASSVISFIGVKMASKPADDEHPFGHGRMEYIAAFIVAFLVIQVGFSLFQTSIGKLRNPEKIAFDLAPFLILVLSIGVKLWMAAYNRKLGKRIESKVMLATSADSMGDVITTSATVLSILISHFAGINVDGIAGLLVSVLVMWSGLSIFKDTMEPLVGEAVDPELYQKITELVESYDGILGTHDLIVHNYGPGKSMASIHAEVPRNVDIEESHEIIDKAEREVARELGILLVIHMDPLAVEDEAVNKVRKEIKETLWLIDENLSFHDFRMVRGKNQINLIFDMVVPHSYSSEQKERLKEKVKTAMTHKDPRYQCVITVDQSFVAVTPEEKQEK